MPPKNPWQYDVNQLDNKGLDVIHPIEQVDKGHYSRMEDVKSLQEGTITPRPGTSLINSSALTAPTQPIQEGQSNRSFGEGTAKLNHTMSAPTYAFVANRLYLIAFFMERSSGTPAANVTSVTAGGGTWVEVATADFATISSPDSSVAVFRTLLSSSSTTGVTWVTDQSVPSFMSITEFVGIDTGGSDGADAIVQSVTGANDAGNAVTVTLSAFGNANNATYAAAAHDVGSRVWTVISPMTFLYDGGGTGATIAQVVAFFDGTDLTPGLTYDGPGGPAGMVAIEIKAA